MHLIVRSAVTFMLVLGAVPIAAIAQGGNSQKPTDQRNPDLCGAGGAGCDPADVQQWKALGNKLADLSSADLSQYAYACAKHREWKKDCETDPVAILKRLGIEGY